MLIARARGKQHLNKMKKFNIILFSLIAFSCCISVSSCGKSGNTPVDQFTDLLEQATQKAEKISSMADLVNVQEIISPEDAMKILQENADYKLSDSDKDKLKKSYDKLLKVAYEKTAEYSGLPDEYKKQAKAQVDLIIEAANNSIDQAKTLGDLNHMR